MATREYIGDGITVHWDSARCFHSERCMRGLPTVFDSAGRPWVHLAGASADVVAAVINTCPSGALSYTRTDGAPDGRRGRGPDADPAASIAVDAEWAPVGVRAADDADAPTVTIAPLENGPLSIVGRVAVTLPDGTVEVKQRCQLCRCGHSGSKPFCDGSHARVGFVAAGASGSSLHD